MSAVAKLGEINAEYTMFKTHIRRDRTRLTITMPAAFHGKRFEVTYANGKLLVVKDQEGGGLFEDRGSSKSSLYSSVWCPEVGSRDARVQCSFYGQDGEW